MGWLEWVDAEDDVDAVFGFCYRPNFITDGKEFDGSVIKNLESRLIFE